MGPRAALATDAGAVAHYCDWEIIAAPEMRPITRASTEPSSPFHTPSSGRAIIAPMLDALNIALPPKGSLLRIWTICVQHQQPRSKTESGIPG